MQDFWKAALSVAGLAGIASFVVWSLYKEWLKLPIWQSLTKKQQYNLFILFMILTFLFGVSGLATYIIVTKDSNQLKLKSVSSLETSKKREEPIENKLKKIFIKANQEHIKKLFGIPIIKNDITSKGLTEAIYSYPNFYLQVVYNKENQVILYSVTSRSKKFRPRIPMFNSNLGESTFSSFSDGKPFYAYVTSKHYGYAEDYYFGNPGNYHHYYLAFNSSGVSFHNEHDPLWEKEIKDEKRLSEFRSITKPNTYAVGEIQRTSLKLPWDFEIGVSYLAARDIPI